MRFIVIGIAPVVLAACATTDTPPRVIEERETAADGQCDARGLEAFLDSFATQEIGAELLVQSGARILQWIPPDTQVTMDYRTDRLRVGYDHEMAIDRIVCQ